MTAHAKKAKLYTTAQTAEKAGTTTTVVRNAIQNGILKATKGENGRFIITGRDADVFARKVKAGTIGLTSHTITVPAAAKYAGVSDAAIRARVKVGAVRSVKVNGRVRVAAVDVLNYKDGRVNKS